MSVLIFANGDLDFSDWVHAYLRNATTVIAANGGAQHALAFSTAPDILIGDLDSLAPDTRQRLRDHGTILRPHSRDKDETDLELALLYAVANFEEDIIVLGALGGRLDQMFANILLLMHPNLRGTRIEYRTEYQRIWLVDGESAIEGAAGDTVSLIPLGGDVHVAHTEGLRWTLHDEVLAFGPARGISNEMVADLAHVRVDAGHLLCIHTSKVWQR